MLRREEDAGVRALDVVHARIGRGNGDDRAVDLGVRQAGERGVAEAVEGRLARLPDDEEVPQDYPWGSWLMNWFMSK